MPDRTSGLLLHVTSLPGPGGLGDFGPAAYRFADRLARAGQRVWQVLPLVPPGHGHSPYSSPSTFAVSPLLISPEKLIEGGLLTHDDLAAAPAFPAGHVDWDAALPFRRGLLETAFERFEADAASPWHARLWEYGTAQAHWLDDYALFAALAEVHGPTWTAWPQPLRDRDEHALAAARDAHARRVRKHQFWQAVAEAQWLDLKSYLAGHGIEVLGDLPIYVADDSADVWAHRDLFKLTPEGRPYVVSGVPPDYFSETGQLWGNPLYRWHAGPAAHLTPPDHARGNAKAYGWWWGTAEGNALDLSPPALEWWTRRMARAFTLYSLVRLDHFRAFAGYWEVPAGAPDARSGYWMPGPGAALFDALRARLGHLPVVAEDLGLITDDVPALMRGQGFPGMGVLQFAFDGNPANPHHPANYGPHTVAYTGTHDNDTLAGWLADPAFAAETARADAFAGQSEGSRGVGPLVAALLRSAAGLVVVPLQDVLGLGGEARMNTPGRSSGQWAWRLADGAFTDAHADALCAMTKHAGRR